MTAEKAEEAIDEALAESFPASDVPAWTRGVDKDSAFHSRVEDGTLRGHAAAQTGER